MAEKVHGCAEVHTWHTHSRGPQNTTAYGSSDEEASTANAECNCKYEGTPFLALEIGDRGCDVHSKATGS